MTLDDFTNWLMWTALAGVVIGLCAPALYSARDFAVRRLRRYRGW